MLIRITDVLPPEALETLIADIMAAEGFGDGAATAGWHARLVKKNEQLAASDAAPLLAGVEAALLAHPVFQAAARPKRLVKLLISRYRPGMEYGLHVDDALMGGERTDLCFTYFLSSPDDYEGGELELSEAYSDRAIKLGKGELILYPSTTLHRVTPVTRGERLAIVGWVRSHVRAADEREILFDLENALSGVFAREGKSALFDTLAKARTNLLRKWAD